MTGLPRVEWPWTNWSLTRKLPLLTATIVVVIVATSLWLAYEALVRTRYEAMHDRLTQVARQVGTSAEQSTAARRKLLTDVARDPAIVGALRAGAAGGSPDTASVVPALTKLAVPVDSGLPIELWTTSRRRIAHVGRDIRNDPKSALPPELRSAATGRPVTEVPSSDAGPDSVQLGSLYASDGHVYYWTVAPVSDGGRRLGYIVQQRRMGGSAQTARTTRALLGEDINISVRNADDGLWASLAGNPIAPPISRDTLEKGFISERSADGRLLATEWRLAGTPWIAVIDMPQSRIIQEPLRILRRLAMFSLLLVTAGVLAAWALSRRITRPLVELTTAAEAIAQGDFKRRVTDPRRGNDEVTRLAASFDHMANEVEASQLALAGKVEEGLRVSRALEQSNAKLQATSREAGEARDAAEQASRAKSDFLAVMSHELRTPLNAIGGYAEILDMGVYGPVTVKQRDAIARIARSQQTLLALINDVLNFAKLEAGGVQFDIREVHIADVISNLEVLVAPQLRDRRLTYVVGHCDDPQLVVRADREKLQQILINLLGNAIKYTAEGGSIEVRCERIDGFVHVHIADSGIGIEADRLSAIFEPFVQVGRALNRPHEGVGLGLAISRDLAHGMGGTIIVSSVPAEGSVFTLTLPAA